MNRFLKLAKSISQIHQELISLFKKGDRDVKFQRFLRHCNCSENFWSETNRQTGMMVRLILLQFKYFKLVI